MDGEANEIATVRAALTDAERARDDALGKLAALRRHRKDERREEQHRLRNMLSVARAIVRRTSEEVETVEDCCGLLESRLHSYLRLQAALAQDWNKGTDLALLLAGELLTFGLQEGDRVELVGPPIDLTSRAAGVLVLAFHELASASVLSGRLGQIGSSLRIEWRRADQAPDARLLIEWAESVPDLGVDDDPLSAWNGWIDQAIAHQLAGRLTIQVTGTMRVARFELPGSSVSDQGKQH